MRDTAVVFKWKSAAYVVEAVDKIEEGVGYCSLWKCFEKGKVMSPFVAKILKFESRKGIISPPLCALSDDDVWNGQLQHLLGKHILDGPIRRLISITEKNGGIIIPVDK